MEKYCVTHYMDVRLDHNYRTINEFTTNSMARSKIIFKGSKTECINYCKIQALDCITKLIDFDLYRIKYELNNDGLYTYETSIMISGYTDNQKDFLWYYSNYYVEEYKTLMND